MMNSRLFREDWMPDRIVDEITLTNYPVSEWELHYIIKMGLNTQDRRRIFEHVKDELTPDHITEILKTASQNELNYLITLFDADLGEDDARLILHRIPQSVPVNPDWIDDDGASVYFIRQFANYGLPEERELDALEMQTCMAMAPKDFIIPPRVYETCDLFTMALFRTTKYCQLFDINDRDFWTEQNVAIALLRVDVAEIEKLWEILPKDVLHHRDIYNARRYLTPHEICDITHRALEGDFTRDGVLYQCDPVFIIKIMNTEPFGWRNEWEEFVGLVRSTTNSLFATPLIKPEHLSLFLRKTDFCPFVAQPLGPFDEYLMFLKCPQYYRSKPIRENREEIFASMSATRFENYFDLYDETPTPLELSLGWLYKLTDERLFVDQWSDRDRQWISSLEDDDVTYLVAQASTPFITQVLLGIFWQRSIFVDHAAARLNGVVAWPGEIVATELLEAFAARAAVL